MPITQNVHFTLALFFSAISFSTLHINSVHQRSYSFAVFGVTVSKVHRNGMVNDSFSCLRCTSATSTY